MCHDTRMYWTLSPILRNSTPKYALMKMQHPDALLCTWLHQICFTLPYLVWKEMYWTISVFLVAAHPSLLFGKFNYIVYLPCTWPIFQTLWLEGYHLSEIIQFGLISMLFWSVWTINLFREVTNSDSHCVVYCWCCCWLFSIQLLFVHDTAWGFCVVHLKGLSFDGWFEIVWKAVTNDLLGSIILMLYAVIQWGILLTIIVICWTA